MMDRVVMSRRLFGTCKSAVGVYNGTPCGGAVKFRNTSRSATHYQRAVMSKSSIYMCVGATRRTCHGTYWYSKHVRTGCSASIGQHNKLSQSAFSNHIARKHFSTLCTHKPVPHLPYRLQIQRAQPRTAVIRYKQTLAKDPNIEAANTELNASSHNTELPSQIPDVRPEIPQSSQGQTESTSTETGSTRGALSDVSVLNGAASYLDYQDGNRVTLFHQPSHHVINVNLDVSDASSAAQRQVTLFFGANKEVVNLSFRKGASRQRPATAYDVMHPHSTNNVTHPAVGEDVTDQRHQATIDDNPSQRPAPDSLTDTRWRPMTINTDTLLKDYMKLAKIRLTGLVVITSMAGYAMAPGVFSLSTFLLCSLGTALQSSSANAINQFFEVPYDSQMNRTKNRPIIRGTISPLHAVCFAGVTGTAGLAILLYGVNPLTAGLGVANLLLYTCIYTPMKRLSILNTWAGSFVGAVPPMMGWAAATGTLDPGAWLLGAIMYAWQFPHFNALSWNLRQDYSRAGYRMTSVVNPALCKRVAYRYTLVMAGLCAIAPALDLTTWVFGVTSLPLNAYFCYLGYQFRHKGDSNASRALFRFSLIHIPVLVLLLLVAKKTSSNARKEPSGVLVDAVPKSGVAKGNGGAFGLVGAVEAKSGDQEMEVERDVIENGSEVDGLTDASTCAGDILLGNTLKCITHNEKNCANVNENITPGLRQELSENRLLESYTTATDVLAAALSGNPVTRASVMENVGENVIMSGEILNDAKIADTISVERC